MPTPEEIEEMDEKEKKEWEDTQRNSRHRNEVLADVRKVMSDGGASDEQIKRVESIFNKQYRPKRFNNRILTKCKVCGKNTPLRRNVRELLLENIVRFLPLESEMKATLKQTILKGQQENINKLFRKLKFNQKDWPGKNLTDIAKNKLPGRLPFCKEHFTENEKYTAVEKSTFRLAPSLKTKIENVLTVIKDEVMPNFALDRVVMEANNFDIAARTKGKKRLAKDEYSKGHKESKETLMESLLSETDGRCVYCGKSITLADANKDHIYPKKAGGNNIFANLVACCRSCNENKKGRTPLESGILPKPEVVAMIKNDLKKKILDDARSINQLDFNKYMSHASIGWRHMRDRLRELTGNDKLPVERLSGIVTAYFRRWWGFKKERGNDKHHALDAVILASRKDYTDDGLVDMTLKPKNSDGREFDPEKHISESKEFKRDKGSRVSSLYDRNPLSIENDRITRRWIVTEIERGKEDTVVSPEWRRKLQEAFECFGVANGKCLTDAMAKEFGLYGKKNPMSLKCYEDFVYRNGKKQTLGVGWDQVIKIKNNAFKTNVHNVAIEIHADEKGRKEAYVKKNPRLEKHFVKKHPPIGKTAMFTFRRGDFVTVEGEDTVYKIKKLGTSPVLEVVVKGTDGKIRNSASATMLTKVNFQKPIV
jgi:5-methylcytosine-specific restriction endonuclease McrA